MTQIITYKGPSGPLFTHGKFYYVTRHTAYGWIVVDDQGVVTSVFKEKQPVLGSLQGKEST